MAYHLRYYHGLPSQVLTLHVSQQTGYVVCLVLCCVLLFLCVLFVLLLLSLFVVVAFEFLTPRFRVAVGAGSCTLVVHNEEESP